MADVKLAHIDGLYYSSVTWKIYNYLNAPLEVNRSIESPEFQTNLCKPIEWKLALTGRRTVDKDYVTEVLLRRSPSCSGPLLANIKIRIAIISNNGKVWHDDIHKASLAVNETISFRCLDIFQNIMDYSIPPIPFDNEIIRIKCDFLHDDDFTSNIDVDLKTLSKDLKKLNMTGNHSNLNLKLGKDSFPVHSAIVKARSPYIARILNKNPNVQLIDLTGNCSYSQLSGLITYWYSSDLEKVPRMPSPSTFNFIFSMEQNELNHYIDPETIVASTIFDTSRRRADFVIRDFQLIEKLKHLEKPIDYMYTCVEHPWKLCFYPKGTTGDSDYFSLNIEEESDSGFLNQVYLEVFMMDRRGKEHGNKLTFSGLHAPGQYPFPKFITHDDFVNLREDLLHCNMVWFGCRIVYGTGNVKNRISSVSDIDSHVFRKENPYTILANDLKKLLESGDYSDISLKAGDKIFRVHKAILAARSRYFDLSFGNRGDENSELDVIELKDIEPEDLEKILKYVYYAEKIVLNPALALKLDPVFRKYKITHLENACSDYFQRHVSADNGNCITEMADKHNG